MNVWKYYFIYVYPGTPSRRQKRQYNAYNKIFFLHRFSEHLAEFSSQIQFWIIIRIKKNRVRILKNNYYSLKCWIQTVVRYPDSDIRILIQISGSWFRYPDPDSDIRIRIHISGSGFRYPDPDLDIRIRITGSRLPD